MSRSTHAGPGTSSVRGIAGLIELQPLYTVLRLIPATRAGAERLGLVTLRQMVTALVAAVENPPGGIRVVDVPAIRQATLVD